MGSDAPVSPLDPWFAMASAVHRSRDDRQPWHPEQSIDIRTALRSSARGRSDVQVGDVADLAVVGRSPFDCDRNELRTMPVAATLVGGRFTHYAL
ncbi:amidohydrolase family protein [Nesterenkonia pannonica]|uniref:amidohydrolase family protein n=1 Tax=Nesterenkonia pannonica TaxID=1548602 RepID=UPI002164BC90|nr:amidohydrolase family protein [Nesterenkonia pannonica]